MRHRDNSLFRIVDTFSLWLMPLFLAALFPVVFPSDSRGESEFDNLEPISSELVLYDSITFDAKLSSTLGTRMPIVTVNVIAPFSANNIPERIDKWLDSVQKYGGQVALKPDPDYPPNRGLGLILNLLSKVYDLAKEVLIYSSVKNYNVDVLYKPANGEITKFVFQLKEGIKSSN